MRIVDFDKYLLTDWQADAIPCDPDGVSLLLMAAFQKLSEEIPQGITLISVVRPNSQNHCDGFGADFYLRGPYYDSQAIVKEMLDAGFRGIGVYWNGKKHSFHGDILPGKLRFWRATKKVDGSWAYGGLICDPKVWPVC